MRRYNKIEEQQIIEFIKPRLADRLTYIQIVNELNRAGIPTANGKTWNEGTFNYFYLSRESKLILKSKSKVEEKHASVSRLIVEALLTEPTLTDKQRVGMLQAYVNA